MTTYSMTTPGCLQHLGLAESDLDWFVGLELDEARQVAATMGLTIFEAIVDADAKTRIMILKPDWLSVDVVDGRVQRVIGLG